MVTTAGMIGLWTWSATTQTGQETPSNFTSLLGSFIPRTPKVEVRVPRQLADKAVAAWQREDRAGDLPGEIPSSEPFATKLRPFP